MGCRKKDLCSVENPPPPLPGGRAVTFYHLTTCPSPKERGDSLPFGLQVWGFLSPDVAEGDRFPSWEGQGWVLSALPRFRQEPTPNPSQEGSSRLRRVKTHTCKLPVGAGVG